MKRAQIKEISKSIVDAGSLSEKDLQWIFKHFSRNDLKLFMRFLSEDIKNKNVTAFYAGDIDNTNKKKIEELFPEKKITFKRDDESLGAGLRFEYADYVLDYSLSGIIKRILNGIRESL